MFVDAGSKYGPTFGTGDTIGCLLDRVTKTIRYTHNGSLLGIAFRQVPCDRKTMLYPSVGLRSAGEWIKANFGKEPFAFDIENYKQTTCKNFVDSILAMPLPSLPDGTSPNTITDAPPASELAQRKGTNAFPVLSGLGIPAATAPGGAANRSNGITSSSASTPLGVVVLNYMISQGYAVSTTQLR